MLKLKLLVALWLLVGAFALLRPRAFPTSQFNSQNFELGLGASLKYSEYWNLISHFTFAPFKDSKNNTITTYKQRYLYDDSRWSGSTNKGPILFYCGNEGPIEMFVNNSGWANDDLATELGALLVYGEHRYFGKSWPFGDQTTSFLPQNLKYLSAEEAMMDFVLLIKYIKTQYKCEDCPVIVFGGSYGGMLATWMRMKHPNVVDIAYAASAPIYYFANRKNFDFNVFFKITTSNYKMVNDNCPDVIRQSFRRLRIYAENLTAPLADLSQWFNLCKPLSSPSDIYYLINYIDAAYEYMAMLNYPYPTNFLKNLPGWPAFTSCEPLNNVHKYDLDKNLFPAIRKSMETYYSYNKTQCNDIYTDSSSDEDMSGWDILACGDQAMPMNMDGTTDMFWKETFNYNDYNKWCMDSFKVLPSYNFMLDDVGGVTDKEYLSYSRIFFTQGGLDPWSGGGPNTDLSDSLVACVIKTGAHHLDLRPPNQQDPVDVKICRAKVMSYMKKWVAEVLDEKASVYREETL